MACKGYGTTHVGKKRFNNQDSILIRNDLQLYAVADGMGGHKGGEVASATAVKVLEKSFEEILKDKTCSPERDLQSVFQKINQAVYEKSQTKEEDLEGMGTTLVVLLIYKNKAFFANVGDSRAYLLHSPYLWRLTEDHSIINEQLKRGLIREDQVGLIKDTNVITRSIGFVDHVEVDIFEKDISAGDKLLLCSDGLTNMVSEKNLQKLQEDTSFESLQDKYLQAALDAGGDDNISIILVSCEGA